MEGSHQRHGHPVRRADIHPGLLHRGWLTVANDDGGAPGTEVGALLQNGSCPNVFFSTNMKTCFGQMTKVGADTIAQLVSVSGWNVPKIDITAG